MTISQRVHNQLFENNENLIRLAPLPLNTTTPPKKRRIRIRRRPGAKKSGEPWTKDEHERFLAGLETFPSGPWKKVAAFVMTRTTRQVMTHAQKYRQKIERWQRVARDPKSTSECVAAPVHDGQTHSINVDLKDQASLFTGGDDSLAGISSLDPTGKLFSRKSTTSEANATSTKIEPGASSAAPIVHHSASFEAIDALLSNWQSILSIETESISEIDWSSVETMSF